MVDWLTPSQKWPVRVTCVWCSKLCTESHREWLNDIYFFYSFYFRLEPWEWIKIRMMIFKKIATWAKMSCISKETVFLNCYPTHVAWYVSTYAQLISTGSMYDFHSVQAGNVFDSSMVDVGLRNYRSFGDVKEVCWKYRLLSGMGVPYIHNEIFQIWIGRVQLFERCFGFTVNAGVSWHMRQWKLHFIIPCGVLWVNKARWVSLSTMSTTKCFMDKTALAISENLLNQSPELACQQCCWSGNINKLIKHDLYC
jgi:hypothetical protein